jgi:hypothetical protein
MNSAPGSLALLLSPKRTACEVGEDPPDNEHGPCGDADEGGCDQHRHPSESQNSDEQRKEGNADGPQPRNLDANSLVRTSESADFLHGLSIGQGKIPEGPGSVLIHT